MTLRVLALLLVLPPRLRPFLSPSGSSPILLFEAPPHDPCPPSAGPAPGLDLLLVRPGRLIRAGLSSRVLSEAPPLIGHAPLRPRLSVSRPSPFAVHGQFSVAVRGCGSGLPGKNDRGLDLHGLLAFIQLQQCAQDRCNAKLNLTSRGLNPAGRWGRDRRPGAGSQQSRERGRPITEAATAGTPPGLGLGHASADSRRGFTVGIDWLMPGAELNLMAGVSPVDGGHALYGNVFCRGGTEGPSSASRDPSILSFAGFPCRQ